MMRWGEKNHHVHDGYEKQMAPPSDVNDTDKDESINSIVHNPFDEPSSENLIMDVRESECNIVDVTLSQSDSSNVTTELNYDDHIKPSANVKDASYFNIFQCRRNLLDKLDVLINVNLQHPKNRHQYHHQLIYLHYEKNVGICRQNFLQKGWSEWTKTKFVKQYPN